jgi:hypothetical protein
MRYRAGRDRRGRGGRGALVAAALALAALCGPLSTAAPAAGPFAGGPWLGLNGNSTGYLGGLEEFVEHRIVYDRGGSIELQAGETLADAAPPLEASIKAGMIPVVLIEFDGYSNCTFGKACLPTDPKALSAYARGFISTAEEILDKWPAAGITFEAINEPWGYGTPDQYAAFLALLLPLVANSHIPPGDVYVGATGEGWIQGLYQAQPQLRTEIQGWYLHPYAKERKPGQGMAEVPGIRAEMESGRDNVTVSEIGFCAVSVGGGQCATSAAPAVDPSDAARALEKELEIARADHRAGWLRAVLVYSRTDGGWAMQQRGGLTEPGGMLEAFGARYG